MVSIHTDAYRDMIKILKDRRKELALSQRDFAKILGVSQSYISKVETCELRLDIIDYFNFAAALQIELNPIIAMLKKHITYYK